METTPNSQRNAKSWMITTMKTGRPFSLSTPAPDGNMTRFYSSGIIGTPSAP